jgi:TorA maturation chaperone TorD
VSRFFADLAAAEAARFYQAVAELGRVFVEIERAAFAMAD